MEFKTTGFKAAALGACMASLSSCVVAPVDYAAGSDPSAIVGTIHGKGDYREGAAIYDIALDLPPGKQQMAPGLTLSYSSRAPDGPFGVGWFMNSNSLVSRCPAKLAMDGYTSGVRYTDSDKLCLNGGHLLLVSGDYGKSGSRYHSEVDSFNEVELHGDVDKPDAYFSVILQNGTHMFLHQTKVGIGQKLPLEWEETSFGDSSGNTVERYYDTSVPGETLLSRIEYTGHDLNGIHSAGTRSVTFDYEPRPDVTSMFVSGSELRQTRRVKSIRIDMPATPPAMGVRTVREYDFSYTQSEDSGRSLMSSLSECAFDAAGKRVCLPATHFAWEDEKPVFQKPVSYGLPVLDTNLSPTQMIDAASGVGSPYIAVGDFDGDGRRELLYNRPGVGAHLYFLNADGSLRKDVDVSSFFESGQDNWYRSYIADMDNDGAQDLPGNVDGHLAFASWDGTGLGKPVETAIPYSREMALADIDGDGQADVLQAEPLKPGAQDYGLFLYRNLGSSPGNFLFGPRQQIALLKDHGSQNAKQHDYFQVMGDLDGRGLAGIAVMSESRIEQVILMRQLPDGSLHADAVTPESIGMVNRPFKRLTYLADINGDGLMDIVYADGPDAASHTWHYQLNIGGRFAPVVDTHVPDDRTPGVGETGLLVADIDGDNAAELIYPDQLLVPYCMGSAQKARDIYTTDDYLCSKQLQQLDPREDLGIYRYASLKFVEAPDGSFTPKVNHDTGIIAQANLASVGDIRGDGLVNVISPFSAWFADGHFQGADGKYAPCPQDFGCGLRIASMQSASHQDEVNSAPDMMTSVIDGLGMKSLWDYYPLSSSKAGLYTVKAVGSPQRYIDPHHIYFDTPLRVVGDYAESSGVGGGFLATSVQYGDAIYDSSGRGFMGFDWYRSTDLSGGIRHISIYTHKFPLDGVLVAEWKEQVEATGDDLQAAKPDPGHGYYLVNTWECAGPASSLPLGGATCKSHNGSTYQQRLWHQAIHDYDQKAQAWLDTDSTYSYDDDGNITRSIVKKTYPTKLEVTDTVTNYAARGAGAWPPEQVASRETDLSTSILDKNKVPGVKTSSVKKETFEYNQYGRTTKQTIDEGHVDDEVRTFTYGQDPAQADFGLLLSISVSHINAANGALDDLHSVHINYTPDGYFPIGYQAANNVSETDEFDPLTGKETKEAKADKTTVSFYDPFGRSIRKKIDEDKKPELSVDMRYLACGKTCPANAVYLRLDTWSNGIQKVTLYNVRDEVIYDPYK